MRATILPADRRPVTGTVAEIGSAGAVVERSRSSTPRSLLTAVVGDPIASADGLGCFAVDIARRHALGGRGIADLGGRTVAAVVALQVADEPVGAGTLGLARVAVDAAVTPADRFVDVVADALLDARSCVADHDSDAPRPTLAAVGATIESADRVVEWRARAIVEALALRVDGDACAGCEAGVGIGHTVLAADRAFCVGTLARVGAAPGVGDADAVTERLDLAAVVGDAVFSADGILAIAVHLAERSTGERVRVADEVVGTVWILVALAVVALAFVADEVSSAARFTLVRVRPIEDGADRCPDVRARALDLADTIVRDVDIEACRLASVRVGMAVLAAHGGIDRSALASRAFPREGDVDEHALGLTGVGICYAVRAADGLFDRLAEAALADSAVRDEYVGAVGLAAVDIGDAVDRANRVPNVWATAIAAALSGIGCTHASAVGEAEVLIGCSIGAADRCVHIWTLAVVADTRLRGNPGTLRLAAVRVGNAVFSADRLPEVVAVAAALTFGVGHSDAVGLAGVGVGLSVVAADRLSHARTGARTDAGSVGCTGAVGFTRVRILDAVVPADGFLDVRALAILDAGSVRCDFDPRAVRFAGVGVLDPVVPADGFLDVRALAVAEALPVLPCRASVALGRAGVWILGPVDADRTPDRAALARVFTRGGVSRRLDLRARHQAGVVKPISIGSTNRVIDVRTVARGARRALAIGYDRNAGCGGQATIRVGRSVFPADGADGDARRFGDIGVAREEDEGERKRQERGQRVAGYDGHMSSGSGCAVSSGFPAASHIEPFDSASGRVYEFGP